MSLTDVEYDEIRWIVRRVSGHALEIGRELVDARMAVFLRRHGMRSVADMLAMAAGGSGALLQDQLVEAMLNHETYFFRDTQPFVTLSQRVLPDLLERRRQERQLRIWSAACSSGQEPYSVAMLLCEHLGTELDRWNVRIIASDISNAQVSRAAQGRYTRSEINRGLPAAFLVRYFEAAGDEWLVAPRVRKLVTFEVLNLLSTREYPVGMDLILLRNVLIYFDESTREPILRAVHESARRDGYVLFGSAEHGEAIGRRFEQAKGELAGFYRPKNNPEGRKDQESCLGDPSYSLTIPRQC